MFKTVETLKRGQFAKVRSSLFMLGYKGYTPYLMEMKYGTIHKGSVVPSRVAFGSGLTKEMFFDRFNFSEVEFLEYVEDEKVFPATFVYSPGTSSSGPTTTVSSGTSAV